MYEPILMFILLVLRIEQWYLGQWTLIHNFANDVCVGKMVVVVFVNRCSLQTNRILPNASVCKPNYLQTKWFMSRGTTIYTFLSNVSCISCVWCFWFSLTDLSFSDEFVIYKCVGFFSYHLYIGCCANYILVFTCAHLLAFIT